MLAPPRGARFVIKLRRDDRPLLEAIRSRFQLGSVTDVNPGTLVACRRLARDERS